MSVIRITASVELPISHGILEVDTSKGSITIIMKSVPVHNSNEALIITKISEDTNIISLFSDTCLMNGADIIIFGVPPNIKVKNGKIKTLTLTSDGKDWKIIKENKYE